MGTGTENPQQSPGSLVCLFDGACRLGEQRFGACQHLHRVAVAGRDQDALESLETPEGLQNFGHGTSRKRRILSGDSQQCNKTKRVTSLWRAFDMPEVGGERER